MPPSKGVVAPPAVPRKTLPADAALRAVADALANQPRYQLGALAGTDLPEVIAHQAVRLDRKVATQKPEERVTTESPLRAHVLAIRAAAAARRTSGTSM